MVKIFVPQCPRWVRFSSRQVTWLLGWDWDWLNLSVKNRFRRTKIFLRPGNHWTFAGAFGVLSAIVDISVDVNVRYTFAERGIEW